METTWVQFTLNGQPHQVPPTIHPATRLVDYIRQTALLKGTKVTCREGGCGVCVVTVQYKDHVTNKDKTRAINSCLCPLYLADGWRITTTEGLGGKHGGFHPIQERMADYNASQCGFCTPGFVMSMYGLLSESPSPTCDDVTRAIDGNLCRCTGYRAIVDAMTSFAKDSKVPIPIDIEDIHKSRCTTKGQLCKAPLNTPVIFTNWKRSRTFEELYALLETNEAKKIRLVVGNTATGIYKYDRYDVFLDIRGIPDLYKIQQTNEFLELGSSLTLTQLQEVFAKYKTQTGFGFLEKLSAHIDLIGNTPIRNAGSWAGNLMIQHDHPEFVSDLLPPLEALGAKVLLGNARGTSWLSPQDLMKADMPGKVILSVRIPALSDLERFNVYKVMLKAEGVHAYVTAAFKMTFQDLKSFVIQAVSITYAGLNSEKEFHAKKTENYLQGKSLTNGQVQLESLKILASDIKVTDVGLWPAEYRAQIAQNSFYKFILSACGDSGMSLPPSRLTRPQQTSYRDFETISDQFPITQTLPKLAGKLQASGEVRYLDDIPVMDNEVVALPVLSTIGNGEIASVDLRKALSIPGVVDVVTAKDIPGKNETFEMQILAKGKISYNAQPICVILAENLGVAYRAKGAVEIKYKNVEKPLVDIDEAIERKSFHGEPTECSIGDVDAAMADCERVIKGSMSQGAQYHFYLENQGCLVAPYEDGYKVISTSQGTDLVQGTVSSVLGLPSSKITVASPRVGGGFGGKVTFAPYVAAMAAIGAWKTQRPVRLTSSLEMSMKTTSHRPDMKAYFKVGVGRDGLIKAVDNQIYWNTGCGVGPLVHLLKSCTYHSDGAYSFPNMRSTGYAMKTNIQQRCMMRSPGIFPGNLVAEQMMEHVAHELGEDPFSFKQKYLCQEGQMMLVGTPMNCDNFPVLYENVMKSADVVNRQTEIQNFNKRSRWVKRGLAIAPGKSLVQYHMYCPALTYAVYMAVYNHDGSVYIAHGGIDYGQGLNTKIAQVAMKMLGLPLAKVKVEQGDSITGVNSAASGASLPSEFLCRTTEECCKNILKKLEPIREQHPEADWKDLVSKAHNQGVHLAVTEKYYSKDKTIYDYPTLGVCVAEAEVDVLTGESRILRADIHMDIGQSINPLIDVGQIEGAMMMGLGLMLTEDEKRNSETGELRTASTWDYKIPTARDIPADIRVTILKGKPNTMGVYSAKALGEPPITTTPAFLSAIRAAVTASRRERGRRRFAKLNPPVTPPTVLKALDVSLSDLEVTAAC